MPTYKAPLEDIGFLLSEVLDYPAVTALPGFEDATPELVASVLEEAAKLCENELQPINRSGDEEGCTFENGVVRTPKGFKEAYGKYVEGGWQGLSLDPAWGGQGLPHTVAIVMKELMSAANMSFGMYPGLTLGAFEAIETHASDVLKALYLPKLASGDWSGTMCLTEPQCGTDLGLIRTRAVPADDGSYRITGTKIFISAGEHDLTRNIIHLVLARLPDAPPGIRGISLFLVPKFLPTPDGEAGPRNGVACGAIEHKMGIRASSTCVMNFDDATGWLVGEPHKGMRAMFTMMNQARLGVGMQGLGVAVASYQNAVAYARDRLQGRSLTGAKAPDSPADPLIVHPDVRKTLLQMKAFTEGARALGIFTGMQIDRYKRHPDPKARAEAEEFVALLTPVVKAFFTDGGFEACNRGMQLWGGHGYIRENGMEQFVRDSRITLIYEGANAIQALDLVGRKMPQNMGRLLRRFFHPLSAELEAAAADPQLAEFAGPLAKAFGKLQTATATVAQRGLANPDEAGAASTDYLRMFGLVALGWMWLRMARAAQAGLAAGGDRSAFYDAKVKTARFYMQKMLPDTDGLLKAILAGSRPVMEMAADQF